MGLDGGRVHRRAVPVDRRQFVRRVLAGTARMGAGNAAGRPVGAPGPGHRRVHLGPADVRRAGGRAVSQAQPGVDAADDRDRHGFHLHGEAAGDAGSFRPASALSPDAGPVAGRLSAVARGGARLRRVSAGAGAGRGVAAVVRVAAKARAHRGRPRLGGGLGMDGVGGGRKPCGHVRRPCAADPGRRGPFGFAAAGAGNAPARGGNGTQRLRGEHRLDADRRAARPLAAARPASASASRLAAPASRRLRASPPARGPVAEVADPAIRDGSRLRRPVRPWPRGRRADAPLAVRRGLAGAWRPPGVLASPAHRAVVRRTVPENVPVVRGTGEAKRRRGPDCRRRSGVRPVGARRGRQGRTALRRLRVAGRRRGARGRLVALPCH